MIKKLVIAALSAAFALSAFAATDNAPVPESSHHQLAGHDSRHVQKHHRHHFKHHHHVKTVTPSALPNGR